jgi:hypothetical protein
VPQDLGLGQKAQVVGVVLLGQQVMSRVVVESAFTRRLRASDASNRKRIFI